MELSSRKRLSSLTTNNSLPGLEHEVEEFSKSSSLSTSNLSGSSLFGLEHEVQEFSFLLKVEGEDRRLCLKVGRSSTLLSLAHALFHLFNR